MIVIDCSFHSVAETCALPAHEAQMMGYDKYKTTLTCHVLEFLKKIKVFLNADVLVFMCFLI